MYKNRATNRLSFSQLNETYDGIMPFSRIISAITSGIEEHANYKDINILYIYPHGTNKSLGVRFAPKSSDYVINLCFRSVNEPKTPKVVIERLYDYLGVEIMNEYIEVWESIYKKFNKRFCTGEHDSIDILFEYNQIANRKNKYKDYFLDQYKQGYLISAPFYEILFNFKIVGNTDNISKDIVVIKHVPNFAILPIAEFINLALL